MKRGRGLDWTNALERHWRPFVLIFWGCTVAYLMWERWAGIGAFALSDTDDNMRIMQVRALVRGQDWFDLRQYRMGYPGGLDIHWSRLVDLPIAGLWLALSVVMDGAAAERWAVAIAPVLPMLVAMGAIALVARRMIGPNSIWLALAILVCANSARSMWAPLRIDHHGWQLAMVAVAMAGLVDPRRVRGGVTLGIASALSLVIGLEMLLYVAMAGVIVGLMWVRDPHEGERLAAYGVSLGGASALGFLLFASQANRGYVCDALSPVWLSTVLVACAAAVVLGRSNLRTLTLRFGAAALAGVGVAAVYALAWPECLGRLERVPAELDDLWLSNVREAMPLYRHSTETIFAIATLPATGLIGYAATLWRVRREPEQLARWTALAALGLLSAALLLWQTRAAAASQLFAVPGAAGLGWTLILWAQAQRSVLLRVFGTAGAFALVSGAVVMQASGFLKKEEPRTNARRAIDNANWRCMTFGGLQAVARQPRGRVLTFVDMGPRLITLTHHDAITGPYHRNADEILDVMRAFRGDAERAREIVERRRIDYVLICPNMSESTVYRADAPRGFYAQISGGRVPAWLEPVMLPSDSPFRMWRVRRPDQAMVASRPSSTN